MKSVSVIAVAALALAHRAAGKTCDESEVKKILSLMGEILKDQNCLDSTNEECPSAKCAPTVIKVAGQLPECSANGENPKASFDKLLKDCKLATTSASAPFSTASTAGVALSSAAVTVAIINESCLKTKNGDCHEAECLKTIAEVTPSLPDCVYDGKNVRGVYEDHLKKCGAGGSSAAASLSTSAAVALSSAAVAIAAVYL